MYFIKTQDGVKIAVYDLNPKSKKTIVMIHGWPLSQEIFEYQKQMLTDTGYRVVTMDLRGFGKSDAPAFGYRYDQLAFDVFQVIRSLKLKAFVLAGFSMGGAVALRYMRLFQGYEVKKLVLLAAAAPRFTRAPGFPYGMTKEDVNQLIQQAETDRAQLAEEFSRMLLACPHSDAIKNWFRNLSLEASGIGTVSTAYSLRDEDVRRDLSFVHVPTGIFHGKKDKVVPFELALLQQESIRRARLFPFENSGHGVFYDELSLFNQTFLTFLESDR